MCEGKRPNGADFLATGNPARRSRNPRRAEEDFSPQRHRVTEKSGEAEFSTQRREDAKSAKNSGSRDVRRNGSQDAKSMMSGLRPDTTGVSSNEQDLFVEHPDVVTLPRHFRNQGYET